MANITAPYGTYVNQAGITVPKGPPSSTPKARTVSPAASKFAKQAARNVMNNRLIPTPAVSRGGRVNPKAPAKGTAPRGNASDAPSVPQAGPVPNLAPEDAALQGTYNDPNFMENSKLSGLAGKVQLPNALQYANSMANMQYGPQIQATAGRIKGLIAAMPGALDSLNKAFANVDAQRQLQAPITSGQGVANLFGGAQGAAAVAANQAVQANNTTANQIGQGNDEAQASARRQADWQTRIQLLNNLAVNQGRSDLAGLEGARGAAQKGFYDQGLKMRGDMISQAISNQGALNNQKIARALASGQLESLHLGNEGKALQNSLAGTAASYAPLQAALGIQQGEQSIITSQINNRINSKAASKALAQTTGAKSLSSALGQGGANAIYGLIVPPGALAQDATTGRPIVYGDLNTYFNKGVDQIMKNLPQSSRKNVKQYVANELQKIASATNQWVYKSGRFQKVASPKAGK